MTFGFASIELEKTSTGFLLENKPNFSLSVFK